MVLLDKLWDDVVAGPQPERGLKHLKKVYAKPLNVKTDVGGEGSSGKSYLRSLSMPASPVSPATPGTPSPTAGQKDNVWRSVFNPGSNLATKSIGSNYFDKPQPNSPTVYDWFKARLVARGFEQVAGVDFFETFSPVIKPCTIRLIFTLAVTNQWTIQQIDVHNAFLNGDLNETIYMSQPEGFVSDTHPTYVCKLQKALYGLKQAPRAWFTKLKEFLSSLGFRASVSDSSLFFKRDQGTLLFVLIYVDDILFTGNTPAAIAHVIQLLGEKFALKTLGEVNYFLGLEAARNSSGLILTQSKYIHDLLSKSNMLQCKASPTPLSTSQKLSLMDSKLFDNPSLYRSTVGTLQYLTITRPDISFAVNKLSQFLHQPTVNHWQACKHLLRYLKGTSSLGLAFTPATRMIVEAYSDADWASCLDDRRSTGGHCLFLGSNLLMWSAKKQTVVSRSSAESEYRSLADTAADVIWVRSLLTEIGVQTESPSLIWCDNMSAVALASNAVFHARTKHVEIDIHFVREKLLTKEIDVRYIAAEDQPADLFTKPLSAERFQMLCSKLPLCSCIKTTGIT